VQASGGLAADLQGFGQAAAARSFLQARCAATRACNSVNLPGSSEASLLGLGSVCFGCQVGTILQQAVHRGGMDGGTQGSLQGVEGSSCRPTSARQLLLLLAGASHSTPCSRWPVGCPPLRT
jgi:hypothetical protein